MPFDDTGYIPPRHADSVLSARRPRRGGDEWTPDPRPFLAPNDTHRMMVIGKTGSGKTQGATWFLANRSYTQMPWIIFNWKYDDLLDDIPHTDEMRLQDKVPKHPGLYMVHPNPADHDAVDDLLWRIWRRERVGVFIDEAYMLSKSPGYTSPAYQAILTQGRSKRIPVITLTQRPSWLSRFAFSEADFIQLYQLTDRRDYKTVSEFMPLPSDPSLSERYKSRWWDNGREYKTVLQPVPSRNTILQRFRERLRQPKRVY